VLVFGEGGKSLLDIVCLGWELDVVMRRGWTVRVGGDYFGGIDECVVDGEG